MKHFLDIIINLIFRENMTSPEAEEEILRHLEVSGTSF